jgi:hypothetical protein
VSCFELPTHILVFRAFIWSHRIHGK